jgi:phage terminase large subunit-like protein
MKETREEYIQKHYDAAFQYEEDVLSGAIIASEYIKQAILRGRRFDDKYYFSEDSVKDLLKFCYYVYIDNHGKKVQFHPAPWQAWIFKELFGRYRNKELSKRLYRDAIIWIARKSGKTTVAAILAVYDIIKGDRNSEAYTVSNTRDQSSISLRYAKSIVNDSPALKKRIRVMQYQLRTNNKGTSIFKALAADSGTLDGLHPSLSIEDEVAMFPTKDLHNVLVTGMVSRQNGLSISISTANVHKDYPFFNDLQIGKKVLVGELEADNTFYAFYTLDEDDDLDDTSVWIKANPNLGVTIDLEDMVIIKKKADLTLTDKLQFQIKNLNVFADSATTWIPDSAYRECFKNSEVDNLLSEKAYLGIDLSSTRDLAALSIVIENPNTGKIETKTEFFFPTVDNEANKIRKSGIDLTDWIDKGWIQEHDKKIIDYDKVYDRIKYYVDNYDVQTLAYDPWGAQILMSELESKLFIDLMPAKQNTAFFNFPMKYIERLIYSKEINLTKNPVLRWCFRNVVIYTDGNGYIKPVKNKSNDSIDGLISLIVALGAYIKINYDAVSMLMNSYNEEVEQQDIN